MTRGRKAKGKGKEVAPEEKNNVGRPRKTGDEQTGFIIDTFDDYERLRAGQGDEDEGGTGDHFDRVTTALIEEFGWRDPLRAVKEEPDAESIAMGEAGEGEEGAGEGGEKTAQEPSQDVKDAVTNQVREVRRRGLTNGAVLLMLPCRE